MTKTKIALAAVLFATTGSAAFAQFGLGYPSYAEPDTCWCSGASGSLPWAPAGTFYSAPVRLQAHGTRLRPYPVLQQRDVALPMADVQTRGPYWYPWSGPTKGGM